MKAKTKRVDEVRACMEFFLRGEGKRGKRAGDAPSRRWAREMQRALRGKR